MAYLLLMIILPVILSTNDDLNVHNSTTQFPYLKVLVQDYVQNPLDINCPHCKVEHFSVHSDVFNVILWTLWQ